MRKRKKRKIVSHFMDGKQKRMMLMAEMGNVCKVCGYAKPCALEFHHVAKKRFTLDSRTLGQIQDMSLIRSEVKRCVLLCSNCHKEVHAGVLVVERG